MKRETILENCQRLIDFIGKKSINLPIKEDELNAAGIVKWYSRILDIEGMPASGVSLLIFKNKDEFDELMEYAKLKCSETFTPVKKMDEAIGNFKENHPELANIGAEILSSRNCNVFRFQDMGYNWEAEYKKGGDFISDVSNKAKNISNQILPVLEQLILITLKRNQIKDNKFTETENVKSMNTELNELVKFNENTIMELIRQHYR